MLTPCNNCQSFFNMELENSQKQFDSLSLFINFGGIFFLIKMSGKKGVQFIRDKCMVPRENGREKWI